MGSDFLFSMPSFLSGAARVLDMGGTFTSYNTSPTPAAADARALASDLAMAGAAVGPSVTVGRIEMGERVKAKPQK